MTARTGGRGRPASVSRPRVALIHGLIRSTGSMRLLARRLEARGFRTVRIGYRSCRLGLDAAVEAVVARLRDDRDDDAWRPDGGGDAWRPDGGGDAWRRDGGEDAWRRDGGDGPLHLVGHSLGGVVARLVAERAPDLGVERIVGLGAPYAGSAMAAAAGRLPGARAVLGPVLDEIPGLVSPPERAGWAAVAGVLPWRAPGRLAGLAGPNDGFVEVGSALGAAPHRLTVPSVHGWLPLSPFVAARVATFLEIGRFERDAAPGRDRTRGASPPATTGPDD